MKEVSEALILLNPFSHSGRAGRWEDTLRQWAPEKEIRRTSHPGEATALATAAAHSGTRVVIAAGGDGTIHEIIQGLVGSETVLGLLPLGTANVLARNLNIPFDPAEALKVIARGERRKLDLIRADFLYNGRPERRYAILLGGAGFDAWAIEKVHPMEKKRWGALAYALGILRVLSQTQSRVILETEANATSDHATVLLGNGHLYGGPFPLFPFASFEDGLMDLACFDSISLLGLTDALWAILRKRPETSAALRYLQVQSATLRSEGKVPFELDGEWVGYLPVTFTVVPKALEVLVPRKSDVNERTPTPGERAPIPFRRLPSEIA